MKEARLARLLIVASLVLAESAGARMFGISWDNDATFGTDGAYSNGLRLSLLGDEYDHGDCGSCLTMKVADRLGWLPGFGSGHARHALSLNVEQLMITPEDIIASEPVPADFPYVGVLRIEAGIFARRADALTGYYVSGGVIGPNSGAGSLQRRIHSLTGANIPNGWDNQLGEDPLFGLAAVHTRRLRKWQMNNGLQTELSVNWRVRADTFSAFGHAGGFVRFGRNLPGNQLPDYAGLGSPASMPGLFFYRNSGWSVFGGVAAEVTPYSYVDENDGFEDLDQKRFVGIAILGAAVHTRALHLSITARETSSHTTGPRRPYQFTTLSLIWRF